MYIVFTFYVAHKLGGQEGRVGLRNWHGDVKSLPPFRARRKIFDLRKESSLGKGFELFSLKM